MLALTLTRPWERLSPRPDQRAYAALCDDSGKAPVEFVRLIFSGVEEGTTRHHRLAEPIELQCHGCHQLHGRERLSDCSRWNLIH